MTIFYGVLEQVEKVIPHMVGIYSTFEKAVHAVRDKIKAVRDDDPLSAAWIFNDDCAQATTTDGQYIWTIDKLELDRSIYQWKRRTGRKTRRTRHDEEERTASRGAGRARARLRCAPSLQ